MTSGASQMLLMVKNAPANVWSLGQEDPLEEGGAIHSSILAWRIPLDRGAWQATVHRITHSQTWLKRAHMQWLAILSIFSCACWQFAYLLKRREMSVQILCPFFICLFIVESWMIYAKSPNLARPDWVSSIVKWESWIWSLRSPQLSCYLICGTSVTLLRFCSPDCRVD